METFIKDNIAKINPHLAKEYGIKDSIILMYIIESIKYFKKNNKNQYDGKTWLPHTYEDFHNEFPFISKYKISEIIYRLCNGKKRKPKSQDIEFVPILVKDKFNEHPFDTRSWYAFDDENKWLSY
jgi:hypothetical protein